MAALPAAAVHDSCVESDDAGEGLGFQVGVERTAGKKVQVIAAGQPSVAERRKVWEGSE